MLERGAARVEAIVHRLREATTLPLRIKLTGQSEDGVVGLPAAAQPRRWVGAIFPKVPRVCRLKRLVREITESWRLLSP